jgi:hypothetical protein
MEQLLVAFAISAAAMGAGLLVRMREQKRQAAEQARHVEAERIVALLSARQPGVWDHEDLRTRMQDTARDLWSLSTREDLARLDTWVAPALVDAEKSAFPMKSVRREAVVTFKAPVRFMQVNEGGPEVDRVIARLTASREATWLDQAGRKLKHERQGTTVTYHTWIHIDGQGWHLEAIAKQPPTNEPPPSSVSCRILPQTPVEEKRAP